MNIKPQNNRVFVIRDQSIPTTIEGFIAPTDVSKWRGKDNRIETMNRGTVHAVGPDTYGVQPGDVIRFSEIQYPTTTIDGQEYVIISDMDIIGVEEEGSYEHAA